ncbi:MAG: hypothetical protein QM530_05740 [Phycisphaerales bacterium]|nr:hypothetical protein [Phycisphaerales bacterium]
MNDITLCEYQLLELKQFIRKRGIREEDVVIEILDHFACKVEELMNSNIHLPFERAIQIAHQSFGKSGFRPMIVNYEKHIQKMMWQIFKNECKKVVLSPKILFLIAYVISLYPLLQIGSKYLHGNWLFDAELIGFGLVVLVTLLYSAVIFFKTKDGFQLFNFNTNKNLLWQKQVMSIPKIPLIAVIVGISLGNKLGNPDLYFFLLCCFSVLTLIRSLAIYQTYLKMEEQFSTNKFA